VGKMGKILFAFLEQRGTAVFLANTRPKKEGVYHSTTVLER
jgi:hypothetical protein